MDTPVVAAPPDSPVLERIRHAILDGAWAPGCRLAPVTLAERFDTSTTVVREALTRLVGETLIEAHVNRGFFIPEMNLRKFADVTELRCTIETLALKLALERGDLHWETGLIAAHHRMVRTPRRVPPAVGPAADVVKRRGARPGPAPGAVAPSQQINEDWRRAHWAFHQALLSACDCEPLLNMAAGLAHATELYRSWTAPRPAASRRSVEREHQDLVDAALARDIGSASRLLRAHYEETARIVMAGRPPEQRVEPKAAPRKRAAA